MKTINIHIIPETGLTIAASSKEDKWFSGLLQQVFADYFDPTLESRLSIQLFYFDGLVNVLGGMYLRLKTECNRCLASFQWQSQIPIHVILLPSDDERKKKKKRELEKKADQGDAQLGIYEGHQVDLESLLKEHILLNLPISLTCSDQCKGLCPTCGQNLNVDSCECDKNEKRESPFSILTNLKLK